MRFGANGVAGIRRQFCNPRVFFKLPFAGVGFVRFVVGRAAVALRIRGCLDFERSGRQVGIIGLRACSRTRFAGSRDGSIADMIGRLVPCALLVTLPWFMSLPRLVALTRLALAGLLPLAGLLALRLGQRLLGLSVGYGAGDLLGGGLRRIGDEAGSKRLRMGLPGALLMTRMLAIAGMFTLPRVLALAGFMRLTGFFSLTWLLALAGLLIGAHGLALVAKLRGGFEAFADRLVGDFGLTGDLLGILADLPLGLGEAVLGGL